ncbi:MAG TPA: 4Fe-4S binding protein [Desulfurobacteriaceae bacterium]|nr:4Fe-4S binding protein [Desulfurobacteriaceae bacterium]
MKIFRKKNKVLIQATSFFLLNPYIANFFTGRLYTGSLKIFPFPILNCWSCPAAVFACPIGALSNLVSLKKFPFYVLGITILASYKKNILCGYICPFGFFQDLIYKIPFYKASKRKRDIFSKIYLILDKPLKKLKYISLIILVLAVPFFFHKNIFCILCPPAFLESSLPLLAIFPYLRDYVGFWFYFKTFVFFLFIFLSLIIMRPFCRYFCPLKGAFDMISSSRTKLSLKRN